MGVPYQYPIPRDHFPASKQLSEMIKATQDGNLTPEMVQQVMSFINDIEKTSKDSPTAMITPINDSNINHANIVILSSIGKDTVIPEVALLPFLGSKCHCPPHDYATNSMVETASVSDPSVIVNAQNLEITFL